LIISFVVEAHPLRTEHIAQEAHSVDVELRTLNADASGSGLVYDLIPPIVP
jgi:hypothetical protein